MADHLSDPEPTVELLADWPWILRAEDWGNPGGVFGPQLPEPGTADHTAWRRRWFEVKARA